MDDTTYSIAVLRASHQRLVTLTKPLTSDQLTAPAYPSEWSVAQVLSHLGSGAEIYGRYLDAGLAGGPAPGHDVFRPIWDTWNAKDPQQQARDAVKADGQLVNQLEGMDRRQRIDLRISMFSGEETVDGLVRLRLNEHALHSWDIAVVLDPTATVAWDAVNLVVDNLTRVAAWSGKPIGVHATVRVITNGPVRLFRLTLADKVTLTPEDDYFEADAELMLRAEAFIRLVYGRLDPDHTPPIVKLKGLTLDDLRRAFPGP